MVPDIHHVGRDDLEALEDAVGPRTCAIFVEIVQGEVGVYPIAQEYLCSHANWPTVTGRC